MHFSFYLFSTIQPLQFIQKTDQNHHRHENDTQNLHNLKIQVVKHCTSVRTYKSKFNFAIYYLPDGREILFSMHGCFQSVYIFRVNSYDPALSNKDNHKKENSIQKYKCIAAISQDDGFFFISGKALNILCIIGA